MNMNYEPNSVASGEPYEFIFSFVSYFWLHPFNIQFHPTYNSSYWYLFIPLLSLNWEPHSLFSSGINHFCPSVSNISSFKRISLMKLSNVTVPFYIASCAQSKPAIYDLVLMLYISHLSIPPAHECLKIGLKVSSKYLRKVYNGYLH